MNHNEKGYRGIVTAEMDGRKRPGLFVRRGNKVSRVATFGSKDDMDVFDMYLHFLLTGEGADDGEHNNEDKD